MNMMHTIKDWTSEHRLHGDFHELRETTVRLVHNPAFWLVIALLVFVTLMIFASYFVIGSGGGPNVPLRPMGWPYYYPYSP